MLVFFDEPRLYAVSTGKLDFRFMPGVNEVSSAEWAELSQHPHVKARLEGGSLEVLDGEVSPKVVSQTVDRALLQKWFDAAAKKPKLQRLIQEQMKKLESPLKSEAKSDE